MMQPTYLKTPEEMYQFSCDHGYGTGFGPTWGKKNFRWVQRNLLPGEQVFFTFVGLHRFRSMSYHQRNFAYAITNKRIVMGQVRVLNLTRLESVPLNAILNISFDYEESIGVMKIMLNGDAVTVGMASETARALCDGLTEFLPLIQEFAYELCPEETSEDPGELPEEAAAESGGEESGAEVSEDVQ